MTWVTGQVLECDGGLALHSPIEPIGRGPQLMLQIDWNATEGGAMSVTDPETFMEDRQHEIFKEWRQSDPSTGPSTRPGRASGPVAI